MIAFDSRNRRKNGPIGGVSQRVEEEAPRKPRGPCILLEVIHIRAIPADSENQVAA